MATVLRSDAQRNLERILEAAKDVFAEDGLEACIADVAARAGVGTATIFRRFPTKEDLVAAVVESRLRELLECARSAAADEEGGFRRFMLAAADVFGHDRALCQAAGSGRLANEELVAETKAAVRQMLKRAQEAGRIRRDVRPEDIPALLAAVSQAGAGARRRRYLEIVLDGLRP